MRAQTVHEVAMKHRLGHDSRRRLDHAVLDTGRLEARICAVEEQLVRPLGGLGRIDTGKPGRLVVMGLHSWLPVDIVGLTLRVDRSWKGHESDFVARTCPKPPQTAGISASWPVHLDPAILPALP
jgi:hypothetical protein